jgi:hypothetical protein
MPMQRLSVIRALVIAGAIAIPSAAFAHSARADDGILKAPLAGKHNNYWYDYRSDIEEAQIELRKDLRRAKTAQDEREAWGEYRRELADARKDYRKEMIELGYVRRGEVIVEPN